MPDDLLARLATSLAPADDQRARFVPSPEQHAEAARLLGELRRGERHTAAVLVPIALPGKTRSVWVLGQPVEYPAGAWLSLGASDYGRARDTAVLTACAHLGERDGMPAYAAIFADGRASMFQDVRLDRLRESAS